MKRGTTVQQYATAAVQIISATILPLCCMALFLCSAGGCSPAKKLTEHHSTNDTLTMLSCDSMALTELVQHNERIALNIQHTTYSKPDSTGFQYIQHITSASAVRNSETVKQTIQIEGSELTVQKKGSAISGKELVVTPGKHHRFFFLIVLLLGVAVLLKRYGK